MFLWIVRGPQSFSQAKNRFKRSLWIIHTKFHEKLKCLRKLAKDNIKPRDPTFSTEHERKGERGLCLRKLDKDRLSKLAKDNIKPYFKGAIGSIDGSHFPVIVPVDEVVNHTNRSWIYISECGSYL
jgi:hypothetical protein